MHAEASGHGRVFLITERHCNTTCGCMMMRITEGVAQSEDGVRPRSACMAKLGSSSSGAVSRPLADLSRRTHDRVVKTCTDRVVMLQCKACGVAQTAFHAATADDINTPVLRNTRAARATCGRQRCVKEVWGEGHARAGKCVSTWVQGCTHVDVQGEKSECILCALCVARINSLYGHHVFQVVDTVFVLMATHALDSEADGQCTLAHAYVLRRTHTTYVHDFFLSKKNGGAANPLCAHNAQVPSIATQFVQPLRSG